MYVLLLLATQNTDGKLNERQMDFTLDIDFRGRSKEEGTQQVIKLFISVN